jgi:acyl carrier protein
MELYEIENMIIQVFSDKKYGLNLHNISVFSSVFFDIGIDSLSFVDVICVIEEKLKINMSDNYLDFNENLSIRDLATIIKNTVKE